MNTVRKDLYDIFVIGVGINGAAVACDAAGRGLSVALAEESATSRRAPPRAPPS